MIIKILYNKELIKEFSYKDVEFNTQIWNDLEDLIGFFIRDSKFEFIIKDDLIEILEVF